MEKSKAFSFPHSNWNVLVQRSMYLHPFDKFFLFMQKFRDKSPVYRKLCFICGPISLLELTLRMKLQNLAKFGRLAVTCHLIFLVFWHVGLQIAQFRRTLPLVLRSLTQCFSLLFDSTISWLFFFVLWIWKVDLTSKFLTNNVLLSITHFCKWRSSQLWLQTSFA